jgi:hypothetical protein
MTKTRRWWILGSAAFAIVAAVVILILVSASPRQSGSDCAAVHQLVEYNKEHNRAVEPQLDAETPRETPLSDYQAWANHLKKYADEIDDPSAASHAAQLAALADQTVALVSEARDDFAELPLSEPPRWMQKYAKLGAQFDKEMASLKPGCPA